MRPAALRRVAVAAQGYATRPRRATEMDVLDALRRLSCVQLDSISVVERSHRLVLSSRVGAYDEAIVSKLLRQGKAFEYWAHEACLLPIEMWPLMRPRMDERQEHHWWGDVIGRDKPLARAILRRIEREGPLRASDFEGRSGGMWDLKPEKRMLEALWTAGKLAVCGREGFQRRYDLVERVVPARWREAPVPEADAWLRALALRAVRARGALTAAGVKEHWRLAGGAARVRPHLEALVAAGALARVEPDDAGAPVYVPADADLDPPAPRGALLLSPFDNLLWDRAFAERAFGFRHVMEIYKRPAERVYGYYVLPLLAGDRLVGRVDVKADRAAGALLARRVHWEARPQEDALARALAGLARTLGLAEISTS